ncbi:MAG: glycosyltransferase family 2 protein [Clostridia bacterium]|nr:glycosyltransferase family 2 protein [Clostridia bacterium]
MPKYSIIVPVYNMEKLLPKCVESIKAQTYEDFEVALVDDCSTDNSYKMCCEIAAGDSRFKVVKQDKNRGLSSTRNLGMKNITGDYFTFIDPDDYVENNLLEEIEKKQKFSEYELITWGMYYDVVYPDGKINIEESNLNSNADKDVVNPVSEDWRHLCMDTFFASTCNKLYRTDIVRKNGLLFDTECVDFEDFIFNSQYAEFVNSFSILKTPFYHYRMMSEQVAPLKRRWATVKRFYVSDKVYNACFKFKKMLESRGIFLDDIMKYAYKAYMNEIEYEYRIGDKKSFRKEVGELIKNRNFYATLNALKQRELKKLVIPMKILILSQQSNLFSELLWRVEKRNLG